MVTVARIPPPATRRSPGRKAVVSGAADTSGTPGTGATRGTGAVRDDAAGGQRLVDVGGGTRLCVETFGDPADPALLLIAGISSSMDAWEDEFCRRLADGRRYVIRYDHRDTGRSTGWPVGEPGYTATDLTNDPVALLDALGRTDAHLVGISMGGGIAQDVAARHPERVASLTLISTSPAGPGDPDRPELPPPSARRSARRSTTHGPTRTGTTGSR